MQPTSLKIKFIIQHVFIRIKFSKNLATTCFQYFSTIQLCMIISGKIFQKCQTVYDSAQFILVDLPTLTIYFFQTMSRKPDIRAMIQKSKANALFKPNTVHSKTTFITKGRLLCVEIKKRHASNKIKNQSSKAQHSGNSKIRSADATIHVRSAANKILFTPKKCTINYDTPLSHLHNILLKYLYICPFGFAFQSLKHKKLIFEEIRLI